MSIHVIGPIVFYSLAVASMLAIVGTVVWAVRESHPADDREWARRSNTDTGLIRPYLAEARDQKRADTEAAKTRAAVETLLAAWQPVEGSPLRWSLEWLARNTDRTPA